MEEILKQIHKKLESLEQGQQELKEGQASLQQELAEFRSEANQKFDNLNNQTETIARTVFKHTETLDKISTDVEFLIHKEKLNEKEIFAIKKNMRVSND